ncbi:hypothetical protein ACTFIR_012245 [Dictyostelium discoideum]
MNLKSVTVVEHDPRWKELFLEEEKQIREVIFKDYKCKRFNEYDDTSSSAAQPPLLTVNVFHCGSTSVPGLKAKPVIDILLVVNGDISELDEMNERFESSNYQIRGENGIAGRRFFTKRIPNHIWVNMHAFQFDNITDIERHLTFRDYLIAHPIILDQYANLKSELASKFPNSIDDYWEGKNLWIKNHFVSSQNSSTELSSCIFYTDSNTNTIDLSPLKSKAFNSGSYPNNNNNNNNNNNDNDNDNNNNDNNNNNNKIGLF